MTRLARWAVPGLTLPLKVNMDLRPNFPIPSQSLNPGG